MRKQTSLCRLGLAFALAAAVVPSTHAAGTAEDRIRELERKLEQSMKLIEALNQKVERLETQRGAQPPVARDTAAAPTLPEARLVTLEREVQQLGSSLASRGSAQDESLPLHGFADVLAGYSGEDTPDFGKGRKGFSVGNLDLYLTPAFGSQVRSLLELVFEVDEDGGLATDLERAQMGYVFSDSLTLWMGRFHNPFGFWNTGFHHGAQIQTSILRPRFLEFEDKGGILPAHGTGLWATGALRSGFGRFEYDAYVINSPTIADAGSDGVLTMNMGGTEQFHAAFGFNLGVAPKAVPGLKLGLHGLRGRVASDDGDPSTANNDTRLQMLGGYATYLENDWEVLAEGYAFRNKDLAGGTGSHSSNAWFVQAGYTMGRTTPFVRFEQTHLSQQDNYFLDQVNGRSYRRVAFGLRYDLDPKAVLKFEYDRTTKKDLSVPDDGFNEARVQYAVRF